MNPQNNEKSLIIALACSPSQGRNSDTMLDNFIEGIKENKNVEIEKIYLKDIKIDNYTFENSLQAMEHEQEFSELCEKIKNASGLVIATPTYNFSVPAHLKNFIDRIRFISLDLKRKNKLGQPVGLLTNLRTFYLVSGGTPKWAQKILFFAFPPFWLRSVFLYYGAHCLGAYYTGDVKSFTNKSVATKCKILGKKYARSVVKCKKNGFLERIFWRPPQEN